MGGILDELRAALHAVWLKRWIALAIAWAICLAGWLVVSQIPNQYQSSARVLVQQRQVLPTQNGSTQAEQQRDIDRVRQTLTSAVNLEKVVRGTDLANTVANDRDVADRVGALQKMIKITAQQDNLFEISATVANAGASDATNAKLAKDIVQKMIDIFVEDNLAEDRDATGQSLRFLDEQIAARQKQLQGVQAKQQDFADRFLSSLPGAGSYGDRVAAARAQIAQVEADLAGANSELSAVNGQMSGTSASIAGAGGTATAGPARARVAAIQGQIAEARGRGWTDSHPDMVALKSQLVAAQAAARNEPLSTAGGTGASANPVYLGLRAQQADKAARVAALNARRNQIQNDLSALQAKLAEDPGAAAEQATIDREYQALKDQYDRLLADREQVRIQSQVQTQTDAIKFSVIDPPKAPRAPSSPNRPLLLTAVLIAGLGGGVAAAFALGKLQTTFSTASRLEKASGMPVIGSIGEVVTAAQTELRRKRLQLFAGGTGALVVAYLALVGLEFFQRGMIA